MVYTIYNSAKLRKRPTISVSLSQENAEFTDTMSEVLEMNKSRFIDLFLSLAREKISIEDIIEYKLNIG